MTAPLRNRTILVATPEDRAGEISDKLRRQGARAVPAPSVRIEPPADTGPLDLALRTREPYDWAVFTSSHGVDSVASRCKALGIDPRGLAARFAAVGPGTASALQKAGLPVDHVPDEYLTDAIPGGLGDLAGRRVLLPRSDLARPSLAEALRGAGAVVTEVVAYRTVPSRAKPEVDPAEVDTVLFTSASSASFLVASLGPEVSGRLTARASAACIGPVTAEAARALGFTVRVVADVHTIDGLIEAIVQEASRHG